MSQSRPHSTENTAPQPQVSFEIREVMSVLTALEGRTAREDDRHVH